MPPKDRITPSLKFQRQTADRCLDAPGVTTDRRRSVRSDARFYRKTVEVGGVEDVFDPQENISAGAAFLRAVLERYKGDRARALAAYNARPEAVDQIDAVPDIPETRAYVTGGSRQNGD
jgi:soluble lytic murein transglycosylase-like protein